MSPLGESMPSAESESSSLTTSTIELMGESNVY